MSEIANNSTPAKVLSDDEIAEGITSITNMAARLPEGMDAFRHLASVFAVYLDETGDMNPPKEALDLELFRVIGLLETRIVALEAALTKAGIDHPTIDAKL